MVGLIVSMFWRYNSCYDYITHLQVHSLLQFRPDFLHLHRPTQLFLQLHLTSSLQTWLASGRVGQSGSHTDAVVFFYPTKCWGGLVLWEGVEGEEGVPLDPLPWHRQSLTLFRQLEGHRLCVRFTKKEEASSSSKPNSLAREENNAIEIIPKVTTSIQVEQYLFSKKNY